MAAPTGASQSPTHGNLQCSVHIESVKFEAVKALTNKRWTKVTSCAKDWLNLSGGDSDIAVLLITPWPTTIKRVFNSIV